VFTERDWLRLFRYSREKVVTLRLWLRFAAPLLAVVAIGFVLGLYVALRALGSLWANCFSPAVGILFIASKWLG
jgi:hypothetical protein